MSGSNPFDDLAENDGDDDDNSRDTKSEELESEAGNDEESGY